MNTRELILDMLMEIDAGKVFSNVILKQVLDKYDFLEANEKAFIKRVTEGTLERQIQIDYVLNQYSKTPVNKMKPLIRNLLRFSLYQILYMDSTPDSAVCNEAVKLAKKRKFQNLSGFVNGVLRTVAREKERISYPDMEKEPLKAISILYSLPEWLLIMWEKQYGIEKTKLIAENLLEIRPVSIRMKETIDQIEKKDLLDKIKEKEIVFQRNTCLSYAYQASHLEGLEELPGFQEGLLTVQDVSSMLVSECAGIKQGDFIIDACAAPGGKSLHAADKLLGTGKVLARDLTEKKIERIQENKERLQALNIETQVYDATMTDKELIGKADILYLDVPCSGLGVIGKKRDIKYHITEDGIEELVKLQRSIIEASWQYVKPGGILMYSTCTINQKENEEQVNWMKEKFPMQSESLDSYLCEELQSEETKGGMLQLFPGQHQTDGFFLARLRVGEQR